MADANPYHSLVEQIIKKQASVLGMAVAVRRAGNVSGLTVSEDGVVQQMQANAIPVLEGLVDQYKALSGAMGVDLCKQAASSFRQAHPDMQLPSILA